MPQGVFIFIKLIILLEEHSTNRIGTALTISVNNNYTHTHWSINNKHGRRQHFDSGLNTPAVSAVNKIYIPTADKDTRLTASFPEQPR